MSVSRPKIQKQSLNTLDVANPLPSPKWLLTSVLGSSSQRAKAVQAIILLNKIFSHEKMKNFVLNHKWNGKPGFADCPMTPEHIWAVICKGEEAWKDAGVDNVIEVKIEFYRPWNPWSKVIGYSLPNQDNIIRTTNRFANSASVAGLAAHWAHESMHILGFVHPNSRNWGQDVAYAIGDFAESLGQELNANVG